MYQLLASLLERLLVLALQRFLLLLGSSEPVNQRDSRLFAFGQAQGRLLLVARCILLQRVEQHRELLILRLRLLQEHLDVAHLLGQRLDSFLLLRG